MKTAEARAFGKLNLTLDVMGRREDGYHDVRMIMQTVDCHDDVTVTVDGSSWRCVCDGGGPSGADNLALRAAETFFSRLGDRPAGLTVTIRKRIPMGGGMAGGSSDAAAALRALNDLYDRPFSREELAALGAEVGSDVPFCVLGGTALAEGRGEILTPLPPLPDCAFVLLRPRFSVSTPELFARLDDFGVRDRPDTDKAIRALRDRDLPDLCGQMRNVFQPVLAARFPVVGELCRALREKGAMAAQLTGTGSVVFGVFPDPERAAWAAARLSDAAAWTAGPVSEV